MAAAYTTRPEPSDPFLEAREQAAGIERYLRSGDALGSSLSGLEEYITSEGREWMRRMMQAHLDLRAAAEVRVPVRGADGVVRGQARPATSRPLRLLVGDVRASRIAYQAAGVAGLHPMDAALQVPDEVYSYGVRRAVAVEVARSAYEDVQDLLGRHLGFSLGKRQLEELAVRAAEDFDAFYLQRTVDAEPTGDLLILSFDGAGIIMRTEDLRAATQKAAEQGTQTLETRLLPGEKRNRKRMAEVAAIYTIAPFQRTVMDVVHGLRPLRDAAAPRPQPTNKRVWASVTLDARDVIREAFQEALRRDPERRRRWVVLVDGNPDQIRSVRRVGKELGVRVTIILDLIHVLEYLWRAAHALHKNAPEAAETWVTMCLIDLLSGRSGGFLARRLRRHAKDAGLTGDRRKGIDACARYLVKNTSLLHYDCALRDGLPIATGVIEGACRYIVRDRLDRCGARWSLRGAEAVLRLRALLTNGDFDAYWAFHLEREYHRVHQTRYAGGVAPCPLPGPRPTLRRVK